MKLLHADCNNELPLLDSDSIKLVYLDPPFSTGKNFYYNNQLAFSDKMNLNQLIEYLTPICQQIQRVLTQDGTFYLHGDYRFIHYAKVMLDDVFGIENFRNQIIWHYNSSPRRKNSFGHRHDVILRYSKSQDVYFNPIREPYSTSAPRGYEKERYYNKEGKVIGEMYGK